MCHHRERAHGRRGLGRRQVGTVATLFAAAFGLLLGPGAGLTSAAAFTGAFGSGWTPLLGGTAVLHQLLALAVVIITTQALGLAFRHLRQPLVVGEILAGILLGPSFLGWVSPQSFSFLFPPAGIGFLSATAQTGIILYMFLAGLELEPALLRRQTKATVAIAEFGILVPLTVGILAALPLYSRYSQGAGLPYFGFFLGLALAVTAFPVLARILTDRHIHNSPIGAAAISSAALSDVTIWSLLAVLLVLLQGRSAGAAATAIMVCGFGAALVLGVRPIMAKLSVTYGHSGRLTQGVMTTVFVSLLICALAAQLIGLNALLGAFALGAVIPHDSGMARELTDRLEDLVLVLLLPAFFAMIGLRTDIRQLGGSEWLLCAVLIAIASGAKVGASALAARMGGCGWRDATALGILMNTRGLIELIVLDIGFGLRLVSPGLFTMLVLLTITATVVTTPIVDWLLPRRTEADDREPAEISPALGPVRRAAIVVAISNPEGAGNLLDLALEANRPDAPPPHVVALARRPAEGVRSGLREVEQRVAPQPPALSAALDHVHARGSAVTSQAVWTDDPAMDILRAAREAQSEWLLLGAHHSVFGSDLRGGVVRTIAERAETVPVNVAVLTPGPPQPLERVFAVVDHSPHGRAALELGIRLVKRTKRSLHVILVPRVGIKPDLPLLEMVRSIGRAEGLRLHTDVLAERSAAQLARQAPGPLVIVGTNLLDEFGLPATGFVKDSHSMIVVQGTQQTLRPGVNAEHDRGSRAL
jgi:Kef-type K+ transport system membrane component KefB